MQKYIDYWFVPRMWEDAEVWILGGGYSLPRIFGVPEKVISKVMSNELSRSAYSKYLKPLHDKHVIGTNMSYVFGDWISVLYFGDLAFWRNNMIDFKEKFKNLKVTDTGNLPESSKSVHKHVKKLKRDVSKFGLSTNPQMLRWNKNSGSAAINLAALFGAKRIILVGFDMNRNGNGQSHWLAKHPGYNQPSVDKTFDNFLRSFPYIAADAKHQGIEIINTSPNSAIEEFPIVDLKEVL